jgi:cytochrome c-type biogenesis protein CcmH/NrfF
MAKFCSTCGGKFSSGQKFCSGCGRALQGGPVRPSLYQRPEVIGVAAFLLIAAMFWGVTRDPKADTAQAGSTQTTGIETYSDSRVLQIASRFTCPCGECNDDLASTCDCGMSGGAGDVRKFIDAELRKGQSAVDVTEKVKQRFGHFVG